MGYDNHLDHLPAELISKFAEFLPVRDICNLRLCCNRKIFGSTRLEFTRAAFSSLRIMLSHDSLAHLERVANHPYFSQHVRTVEFTTHHLRRQGHLQFNCSHIKSKMNAKHVPEFSKELIRITELIQNGEALYTISNALTKFVRMRTISVADLVVLLKRKQPEGSFKDCIPYGLKTLEKKYGIDLHSMCPCLQAIRDEAEIATVVTSMVLKAPWRTPMRIKSMYISTLSLGLVIPDYRLSELETVFSNLTTLRLNLSSEQIPPDSDFYTLDRYWVTHLSRLFGCTKNVTNLKLAVNTVYDATLLSTVTKEIRWPPILSSLRLETMYLDGSWTFLSRCPSTLKHLTISAKQLEHLDSLPNLFVNFQHDTSVQSVTLTELVDFESEQWIYFDDPLVRDETGNVWMSMLIKDVDFRSTETVCAPDIREKLIALAERVRMLSKESRYMMENNGYINV
jgi:hypothetical protein